MRRIVILLFLLSISLPSRAQAPSPGDYTGLATEGDFIAADFRFHTGETLPADRPLRLHYATWGTPRRNAAGEITNAVLLLHGTLGSGINWGRPSPVSPDRHPLLGAEGPLDASEYYVIAPDTIGSGKSSRPSDGLRMSFPHYNLEDIVAAERRLVEHLGVKHLVAVVGASMGGRQTWQWGIQYPEFMDALVPAIASPFPNAGRRGIIDFLTEAIVRSDPQWNQGNYQRNPPSARLADLFYTIFLRSPGWFDRELPTRGEAERWVREGQGLFGNPDANDLIYMMRVNDGFDAWSQIDRVRCPVMIINMAGDEMVPIGLRHADRVMGELKNATYLEIEEEAEYGHGAFGRTINVWGPRLRDWLRQAGRAR